MSGTTKDAEDVANAETSPSGTRLPIRGSSIASVAGRAT